MNAACANQQSEAGSDEGVEKFRARIFFSFEDGVKKRRAMKQYGEDDRHQCKCDREGKVEGGHALIGSNCGSEGDDEGEDAVGFGLGEGGEPFLGSGAEIFLLRDFFEDSVAVALVEVGDLPQPASKASSRSK